MREGGAAFEGAGHGGGDLVDLGRIDADATRPGDQAFFFGSDGRGGLWLEESGRDTCVLGNVDGNRAPEFEIVIRDGALRASDYAPGDFVL